MNLVRVYYHNVWEPIYPFNQSDPSKAHDRFLSNWQFL
mgnify:CR=1 FL=1